MKKLIALVLSIVFLLGVCRLTAHDPVEQKSQDRTKTQKANTKRGTQKQYENQKKQRSKQANQRKLGPGKILGEQHRVQTIRRVVGRSNAVCFGVEGGDDRDWAEYLFTAEPRGSR